MKYYTYRMEIGKACVIGLLPFLLFFIFPFSDTGLIECAYVLLWLILHEFLHYLGFIINKEVKAENVVMGMAIEKGIMYCMCKQEIRKKSIIISMLFPLIFIGIGTLLLGILLDNNLLTDLSIINLSGCCMDLMMLLFIVKLPKDAKYADFDDPTSFTFLSEKDLAKYKMYTIKLEETGEYNPSVLYAKDKKKITITKPSIYMVIAIGVLTVIHFVSYFV